MASRKKASGSRRNVGDVGRGLLNHMTTFIRIIVPVQLLLVPHDFMCAVKHCQLPLRKYSAPLLRPLKLIITFVFLCRIDGFSFE